MDIGYHFDLSELVMSDHNFSKEACELAMFGNAMTDLLGNFATMPGIKDVLEVASCPFDGLAERLQNASKLHCDNLLTQESVVAYVNQVSQNLKSQVQSVQGDGNETEVAVRTLIAIGILMHTVQDFCSHSTFVFLQPPAANPQQVKRVDNSKTVYLGEYVRRSPFRGNRSRKSGH